MTRVGIEKIHAYPCTLALDMVALAEARGVSPGHPVDELWVDSRSLNPVWEDPVTMAVNAARGLLVGEDPEQIELIVVGSESSVDFGKPMSTWVQRMAGVGRNCRNFETKHACYGGTAGLMMAAHWIASGQARGKKALVVCADQSRSHIGKPWEFVLGAASVAMLISDKPDFLEFELDKHGYWTQEISDTYRPTSRDEVGHAETSLFGYLEAVEGACEHFMSRVGPIDYDQHFARHVYHVPFGALTWRGHRAVSRRWQPEHANKKIHETFERKSKPGLRYNRRFGGSYTSATFLALMGTVASAPQLQAGERISVFSYGSGSCAEFYSVKVGERAHEVVAKAELDAGLDARRKLSVPEYEALEGARALLVDNPEYVTDKSSPSGLWQQAYEGRQLCVLDGVHAWERDYRLS
jgi:3-hydroxy-3-methylglutaryl CoA synthase